MFLIIDGGTTNLRVTLLSDERKPLDAIARDGGVRHTAVDGNNGRLKAALAECIDQLLARNGLDAGDVKRCVAYGMITSDMGLLEIPHVPAPASAADLRDAMRAQRVPEIAPFPIHFIPGVRNFAGPVDLDNFGMMDMMRGEETEAVGLFELLEPETSAMFILPGSHNKFVAMSAEGKILGCMTSISGELLDAMTHHTILADAVGGAFVSPEAYDAKMAMKGAWACAQNGLGRAAVQLLNQPVGDGDLGQQFPARGAHQALMQIHSAHRPAEARTRPPTAAFPAESAEAPRPGRRPAAIWRGSCGGCGPAGQPRSDPERAPRRRRP